MLDDDLRRWRNRPAGRGWTLWWSGHWSASGPCLHRRRWPLGRRLWGQRRLLLGHSPRWRMMRIHRWWLLTTRRTTCDRMSRMGRHCRRLLGWWTRRMRLRGRRLTRRRRRHNVIWSRTVGRHRSRRRSRDDSVAVGCAGAARRDRSPRMSTGRWHWWLLLRVSSRGLAWSGWALGCSRGKLLLRGNSTSSRLLPLSLF